MAIKTFNPITPGTRQKTSLSYDEITKVGPEKALTKGKGSKAGRNSAGRISVRRRGGGHKRKYRAVDFLRNKYDIPAKVAAILFMAE